MASDLAAIRAEGRRLMAAMEAPADDDPDWIVATDAFGKWMYDHASDLLADPAPSITDARRRWDAHWRDGECGGERCLGDRSWANYDDARLLAQLQRVKRQEQSDD